MILTLRIIALAIACASPLLTLAKLWQLKEWRIDRLKEHLRAEGWTRQLIGTLRPLVFVVVLGTLETTHLPAFAKIDMTVAAFAALSLLQIITRKQRYPVWTMKALILVVTAVCIDAALPAVLPNNSWFLALLPMLQAVILLVVWAVFLPIDHLMKERIMRSAAALRSNYDKMTVIGITGSVGKTTTKELLAHLLKNKNPLFTPAYVNSEMGVAKWMLQQLPKRNPEEEGVLIAEMGAYRTGEIAKLCSIVKPSIGIVTFIGTQHIALFGSQEKLCAAKGELPASLPENGTAFLNGDNTRCSNLKNICTCNTVLVGTGGHADIEAFDIEETGNGIQFRIGSTVFAVPLYGTHNVTNVLLAIGVARHMGMSDSAIAASLKTFTPPHNTFSVRTERGITVLDDTHNASPESFRAAIAWATSQPAKRIVIITPGLIELGTNEDRIHRELGEASASHITEVVFLGKSGREAFRTGYGKPVHQKINAVQPLQSGDLLLCIGRTPSRMIKQLLS